MLATLFAIVGGGMVVGGAYYTLSESDAGWMPLATGIVLGPLSLYTAYHLLRLTHWGWLTLLILILLLLASSLLRAFMSASVATALIAELAVEAAILLYLLRPSVRRAFNVGR